MPRDRYTPTQFSVKLGKKEKGFYLFLHRFESLWSHLQGLYNLFVFSFDKWLQIKEFMQKIPLWLETLEWKKKNWKPEILAENYVLNITWVLEYKQ